VSERKAWFDKQAVSVASDARHLATRLLGECDDDSVVSTLLCALADPGSELRHEAADSLARIAERNPELPALTNAWGALVTHLKTDGRSVRLSCARALGALGQRKSIAVLVESLEDEDPSVRTGVIAALSRVAASCSPKHPKRLSAMRQITDRLHDAEDGPRRAAAIALLDLGDEATLHTALGSLIRSKNSLGPAIRVKLHEMRGQSGFEKQLVDILSCCSDSSERRPVIECIGEIYQVREHSRRRAEEQMA
jgi:HEAT repeat protein